MDRAFRYNIAASALVRLEKYYSQIEDEPNLPLNPELTVVSEELAQHAESKSKFRY